MNNFSVNTEFGKLDLNIPEDGQIACSVSGGADSMLVLYLICHFTKINPKVLFLKNANSSRAALEECINYLNIRLNTELSVVEVERNFTGSWIAPDLAYMKNQADYIFYGTTKNPSEDILQNDKLFAVAIPPNRPTSADIQSSIFNLPLLELDKRFVISTYKQLGLLDLYNLTHSCTEKTEENCGLCFACSERKWAERENNLCLTHFQN